MTARLSAAAALSPLLSGCAGHTLGENDAGNDTYLGYGSIAVDHVTEDAFVLQTDTDCTEDCPQTLFGLDAEASYALEVADLTGREDLRMLFPEAGLMTMAQSDEHTEELTVYSRDDWSVLQTTRVSARYHGTRMSPTHRWVAVADGSAEGGPIHVVDPLTLDAHVMPTETDITEAMWLNGTDVLTAILVDLDEQTSQWSSRLVAWGITEQVIADVADQGSWPDPLIDVTVDDMAFALGASWTWIAVSPDDSQVVFPVWYLPDDETLQEVLLVLDLDEDTVEQVPDAGGPVGFTPDGSTIVAHGQSTDGEGALLLIDAASLAVTEVVLPLEGSLYYFVSHEGNQVVAVAAGVDTQDLVVHDLDSGTSVSLGGAGLSLNEFVTRPATDELWLVDALKREAVDTSGETVIQSDPNDLFVLDLGEPSLAQLGLDFEPAHLNIQPTRDRLILDDQGSDTFRFFDLGTREVVSEVVLPLE